MLPPLLAQTPPPAAEAAAGLVLPAERYAALVGQPPAAGSRGEADDLAILRWLQLSRTAEAASRTWSFLSRSLSRFDAAIGADLNRTAPTLTAGLPSFLRVITTVKDELKTSHARPRPFLAHPDLRPCLPLEDSPAYPSGHALWYAAAGQLLADLLPERRERLLEVGRQGGLRPRHLRGALPQRCAGKPAAGRRHGGRCDRLSAVACLPQAGPRRGPAAAAAAGPRSACPQLTVSLELWVS
ncbi:MAG: hypothetical protein ACKO2F_06755 [Cyanobacteriota bacterium]